MYLLAGVSLVAVAAAGLDASLAAGGGQVVESRQWDGISFETSAAFGTATLVVSGPDGSTSEQTFGPGEVPFLSALDLADGTYSYQLTVKTEAAAGSSGSADATGDARYAESRASGSFSVRNGQLEGAGTDTFFDDDDDGQVINRNLIVEGSICASVTEDCKKNESFKDNVSSDGQTTLKLKEPTPNIWFDDRLDADFLLGAQSDVLRIFNEDEDRRLVGIEAGAGLDQLYLRSDGRVGINTSTPETELHIEGFDSNDPTLRLEDGKFHPSAAWDITVNEGDLLFNDVGGGAGTVLALEDLEGEVGIGERNPEATLEVSTSGGETQVLVEENSASTKRRTLLQLTNNGRAQIRLSNTATDVNWVAGMGTNDSYILRRGANEFRFNKGGRVRWFLGGDPLPGFDYIPTGDLRLRGTLTENSDVNAKRDIEPVDGRAVLSRVAALPVSTWTYKDDDSGARHVGPMAQDFHAAFGLGHNDTSISPRDVAGIALAAVKELQAVVRDSRAALQARDAEIAALRERLTALEAKLAE